MKPTWIIENLKSDSYKQLTEEAQKQGFECLLLDSKEYFDLQYKPENKSVIFHGSIQLAQKLKKEWKNFSPVVWLTEENYNCSKYYAYLGKFLFNDQYLILSAKELERRKWEIYSSYGKEACIFVRPDSGLKSFTGQVIDLQDFDRIWQQNYEYGLQKEDLVVVSIPKNIVGEWRFICTKEKIIAGSSYRFHGLETYIPSFPDGAKNLVDKILETGYYSDKVFSIDICMGEDKEFYLLEINSFSTCGTYACNKESIVKEVSKLV